MCIKLGIEVRTKQWSEFLRERVKRERVAFLVKWAKENGVDDYQRIYEKARSEFPMASKENTHCYTEAALKILKKKRPVLEG
jgi:hypothetical protein